MVTIAVTLVLLAGCTAFLKRTRYGVQIRAAAEDFLMARYLRQGQLGDRRSALSGILAAKFRWLFVGSETGTLTNVMGVPLMLYAFIATVVGGMGSLVGALESADTRLGSSGSCFRPIYRTACASCVTFVFATVVFGVVATSGWMIPTKALVQRV